MLSLLRLLSVRHLLGSPLRTVITVLGVALGVATLVGITAINRSVMGAFRTTIDTIAGKADLTISGSDSGFDEAVLEKVRAIPGVAHAAGMLTVIAPMPGDSGESLYVMGVDFLDDGFFRSYQGADRDVGAINDDLEFLNSTDRMLVSEKFANARHLKAGDAFKLQTADGVKEFVVHGVLKDSGAMTAFGGSVGVMFFASAQEGFSRGRTFDRIDVAADPSVGWETVRDRIQKELGPTLEVDRPDRRGGSVETMLRSFQLGLNLGSAVALLVGIFLVYNTISIQVVQRRREVGTLRALGATKGRIRWLFALEAAVLGLAGSAVGLPLGVAVGKAAVAGVAESVSSLYVRVNATEVTVGAFEIGLGLALGVFGSVFAALRPAFVASSVAPVEALRKGTAIGTGAAQLRSWPTAIAVVLLVLAWPVTFIPPPVENLALGAYLSIFFILMAMTLLSPLVLRAVNAPLRVPGEGLFGIAGRLAADNFARAPVRTAVPVSALAIGVGMAISIAGFIGSFQLSTIRWIEQAIPADLFVTSSSKLAGTRNQPMKPELAAELAALPDVKAVDQTRLYKHDVLGLRVYVVSVDFSVYGLRAKPVVLEGSIPTLEERRAGVVTISENFALRRNLKPGMSFPMMTPTGEHQYKVGGVILDYTSDQGTIVIDRSVFTRDFADDRVDSFHVYVNQPQAIESVRAAITAKYGQQYNLYVLSNAELKAEALRMVDDAFAITTAMEIVAVALALLGVVNTLLAAVIDRTREIGLLRAVGADRRHITQLITSEAGIIGLVGGAMGLALGGVTGFIITHVVGVQATGWDFPFVFPWPLALQMLVTATVCAIVAGVYPARRAASLDVVEALAYE